MSGTPQTRPTAHPTVATGAETPGRTQPQPHTPPSRPPNNPGVRATRRPRATTPPRPPPSPIENRRCQPGPVRDPTEDRQSGQPPHEHHPHQRPTAPPRGATRTNPTRPPDDRTHTSVLRQRQPVQTRPAPAIRRGEVVLALSARRITRRHSAACPVRSRRSALGGVGARERSRRQSQPAGRG